MEIDKDIDKIMLFNDANLVLDDCGFGCRPIYEKF